MTCSALAAVHAELLERQEELGRVRLEQRLPGLGGDGRGELVGRVEQESARRARAARAAPRAPTRPSGAGRDGPRRRARRSPRAASTSTEPTGSSVAGSTDCQRSCGRDRHDLHRRPRRPAVEVVELGADPGGQVVFAHVGADRLDPRAALVARHLERLVNRLRLLRHVERVHRQRPAAQLLVRAGVLGQDEHAVPLVHERRFLRDQIQPVEDRVHEQDVVLLVRGDGAVKSSSTCSSIGVQPSSWKRSLTDRAARWIAARYSA